MTALAADKRALAATARMGWAASAHAGHEDTVTAGVSATAADNAQAEKVKCTKKKLTIQLPRVLGPRKNSCFEGVFLF